MSRSIRIRAAAANGVTEVRVLMAHPMETGLREAGSGEVVPAHYITTLKILHDERIVLDADLGPAVSANPYLAFKFQGGATGDTLTVRWEDNRGESAEESVEIL